MVQDLKTGYSGFCACAGFVAIFFLIRKILQHEVSSIFVGDLMTNSWCATIPKGFKEQKDFRHDG